MLGVDIVSVKRIAEINVGGKIENRILSDREKEYLGEKCNTPAKGKTFSERENSLAGFWAAKEAVTKALEIGLKEDMKEIEILHKDSGAPYVELSKNIAKKYGFNPKMKLEVSISHDDGMAIAICFLR